MAQTNADALPRGSASRLVGDTLNRDIDTDIDAMDLIFGDDATNTGAARWVGRALRRGLLQDRLALITLIHERAARDQAFTHRFRGAIRHADLVNGHSVAASHLAVAGIEAILGVLSDQRSPDLALWVAFYAHYCGPNLYPGNAYFTYQVAPEVRRLLVTADQLGLRLS